MTRPTEAVQSAEAARAEAQRLMRHATELETEARAQEQASQTAHDAAKLALAESFDLSERGTRELAAKARLPFETAVLDKGEAIAEWLDYRRELAAIIHRQNVLSRHYNNMAAAEADASSRKARLWNQRICDALYTTPRSKQEEERLVDELNALRDEIETHFEAHGCQISYDFFNYRERVSITPNHWGFREKPWYPQMVFESVDPDNYGQAVSNILKMRASCVEEPEGVARSEMDIEAAIDSMLAVSTGGDVTPPRRTRGLK